MLIFLGIKIETFFDGLSFIKYRHFLPFGRADLTTFAIIKLSSPVERGDLMMIRQRHEIAYVASLLETTSAALWPICGGRPQLHGPRLASDDIYLNNIVVASGAWQSGNLDS